MSIRTYEKNGKKLYEVYVHVKSGSVAGLRIQRRKTNLDSYQAAVREEKRMLKEASKELSIKEERGSCWKHIVDDWETEQLSKEGMIRYSNPHTVKDYASLLRRWTKEWFPLTADELNRGDGKKVINDALKAGKTKSFVKKLKFTINLVFNWAIDNRIVKRVQVSPVYGIKIDCKEEKFPEILNLVEIRKFLYEAKRRKHDWYPIWAMALLTGMRSGELYALEWDDIDFEKKLIRVKKSYNKRMNAIKSTKAGYWRNVPISDQLYSLLVELKSTRGNEKYVLRHFIEWVRGEQAKPLRAFLKEIGLPPVKFHTLRACFATQLLGDGVEMTKVMKIGGWRDLKTMQIYMRLAGIDEKGATQGLKFLPSDEAVMDNVVNLFQTRE